MVKKGEYKTLINHMSILKTKNYTMKCRIHHNGVSKKSTNSEGEMKNDTSVLRKDFPEKLKQLRNARDWSQGMLAQKIGVEANRISKYERGIMWPTLELVVKISNAFGVSVDYLVRDDIVDDIREENSQKIARRLERIRYLPEEDQTALLRVLDAFIKKASFEKVAEEDLND